MSTWHILAIGAATVTLVAAGASAGPYLTAEQVRQSTIAAPKPVYPDSARQFKLYVHVKTGELRSVKIMRSTGNRALDAAALWALLQWRFKPSVLPTMRKLYPPSKEPDADKDACVCVPISFLFTSAGAQVH
jgi:TonB family protein